MLTFLTDALAVHRLTKLVTQDQITEQFREEVWEDYPPESTIGYLITCPWCVSVYVGVGVMILRATVPRVWDPLSRALAASSITGIIEEKL